MQLGRVESMAMRNRMDLDIQLRRIAQLQDELDMIKKVLSAHSLATDSVLIPLPTVTVES